MRIKKIEIDGFGVWKGLTLEELSSQATVIHGPNEAGKTTLMQFVRAVLYGLTPERRKRYLPPVHGGQPGGRMQVANEFGSFTLAGKGDVNDTIDNPGLLEIIDRRETLREKIVDLSRKTGRWKDLATQRTNLIDEAKQLEKQIVEIEAASHVLRAALEVEGPWNIRADIQRQLEILKDVRPLPERSVERLDSINQRLATGRKRLKKLSARREQLKKDGESLEVNKVLLTHAGRIESLHDQSQWIIGLENQVTKLREEVAKLDADIEAAVTGYRSAG